MAGNGSRFFEAGYDKLKPLIDIKGKPMFSRVIHNISCGEDVDVHVIVRRDHVEKYNLAEEITAACPDATVMILEGPTQGAACTVLKAVDMFSDEPFFVANCDQLMDWDKSSFYDNKFLSSGGTILTFMSDNPKPLHSYVTRDEFGFMVELAEKRKISDEATVGVYVFGSQKKFAAACAKMIDADDRTNGEFYLAPVYNYMEGLVNLYKIDNFLGLGTPEELEELKASEWWDKLDDLCR